ncbi:efflux RND transporter periplasmic adaptor subunit [Membranihabitans maritimus]|uniref:efflux RND transporter periplasmic adaptor subunit n=1 Tax=Membranihabitans maritimus TaxID=2904244 RepID=UPI001F0080CE|nr:efflux RND transporter periplasmic adaptor subunit [Membranihabitans maritimus]
MDIEIKKKRGLKKKHIGYIAIAVFAALTVWALVFSNSESVFRTEKDKLVIAEVTKGEFDDYITINGTVAPIATIYMDAYEGGRVSEKLIEEGAMVSKGDIILKLENQNLYEQILASESNLALKENDLRSTRLNFDAREIQARKELVKAEYDLKRFKRNFEQNKSLFADKLIPKEEYLITKEDYELGQKQYDILKQQTKQDAELRKTMLTDLETDLARMRQTLTMVYQRIDHLNVRAPADGQLGFLDAEIGQRINQGERIGQINILTDFKIEALIDEHYIDRVRQNLTADLDRNGNHFPLRLRKVYPEVRDGRFRVDLVFTENKPETIRAGQNYNLRLQLGESQEALLLSRGGFYQSTGGQYVYVLDDTGETAEKRNVRIGKQNSQYYEVLEGLNAGEKVITSSYDNFGNAEKIVLK